VLSVACKKRRDDSQRVMLPPSHFGAAPHLATCEKDSARSLWLLVSNVRALPTDDIDLNRFYRTDPRPMSRFRWKGRGLCSCQRLTQTFCSPDADFLPENFCFGILEFWASCGLFCLRSQIPVQPDPTSAWGGRICKSSFILTRRCIRPIKCVYSARMFATTTPPPPRKHIPIPGVPLLRGPF
jgi:hypothetical protein